MRIVSGSYRGRRLACPEGLRVRPTLDRIKENLFNLLPSPEGCAVLDLFAGAGGLGIEALSRGAAFVAFCDSDAEAIRYLRRNLERMAGEISVLERDFSAALRSLAGTGRKFDLVFLDPPYHEGLYEPALKQLSALRLLAPGAVVAAESDAEQDFSAPGYAVFKQRRYGLVQLTLLKPETEETI